ncbi:MAG: ABC transporter substrate-binding protein [Clostridiales bacterium]|nr:ABC transporter substrate-binding protein [Clostridiales bacterium]
MKKTFVVILVLLLVAAPLGGCSSGTADGAGKSSRDADSLPVLRVGTIEGRIGFNLWYIMENGLDIENGFRIEKSEFTGGGVPVNEALGAGLLDIAHIGSPAGVNSAAVFGAKILCAFLEGAGFHLFARPDSDIVRAGNGSAAFPALLGSAETVRETSVLYPVGTMAQIGVYRYLDAFGLNPDDIISVNMQLASAYQAFRTGEGDIIAIFSPTCYTAYDEGLVKIATLYEMDVPMYNVLIANDNTYEQNKELIKKYIALLYEVNDMMTADKELQIELLFDFYKISGTEVDIKWLPEEIETMYLITSEQAKTIDHAISVIQTAEFYIDIGVLEADKLDIIKERVDLTLLKEVLGASQGSRD